MHFHSRVIALAALAPWIAISGCKREPGVERESQVTTAFPENARLMAKLDSAVPPPGFRPRHYRNPDTKEADATHVIALRTGGADRFILHQMPLDGGEPIVVADSAGVIPVFESHEAAKAYRDRVFPLDTSDSTSHDAIVAGYQAMAAEPLRVDLDALGDWISSGDSPPTPAAAARIWEVLAAANAMPSMAQMDPMGLAGLTENFNRGGVDTAVYRIVKLGMIVSGLAMEGLRGRVDATSWPTDTVVWSGAEEDLLRELMRRGIARLTPRLSAEAAQRDVTETWAKPSGATLEISMTSPRPGASVELPGPFPDEVEPGFTKFIDERIPPLDPTDRSRLPAGAYERYQRDREQYRRDLTAYRRLSVELSQRRRRSVELRFLVKNTGDQRAPQGLRVRLRVPAGLEIVLQGSDPRSPELPDELRPPSAYADPSVRRAPYRAALRPSSRETREKGSYDEVSRVSSTAGGTVVERPLFAIASHDAFALESVIVRWASWDAVRPFDVTAQIVHADTVLTELTQRIDVTVRRRQ